MKRVIFTEIFKDETRFATKIPQQQYLSCGKYPIIDQGNQFISGYFNSPKGIFEKGDAIVFGDHTRILKFIDHPFFIGADGVKILRPANPCDNIKFLYYALKALKIPSLGYSRHFKILKESLVGYTTDRQRQNRIVEKLDKIILLISYREKQLLQLRSLASSRFIEMFGDPVTNPHGWETRPLDKLGELNRGVSKARPRNSPDLLGGEYPLVQTGEVANSDTYITEFEQTYSEKGLAQSKMWKAGTLCITIAANIAQTAILTFDACFPDSVVGFIANNQTRQLFIHHWFKFFQKVLEEQAPQVAQKNINLKILKGLLVIAPPLALQDEFVAFIEQLDKSKVTIQKSLDRLNLLYKALLQEYFG